MLSLNKFIFFVATAAFHTEKKKGRKGVGEREME